MERFNPKFNQIIAESAHQQTASLIRSFIVHTPSTKIKKLGKLFGLIEGPTPNSKALELIDVIVEEVQKNYYERTITDPDEIESAFEQALQKTNLAIAAFIESQHVSLDVGSINICLGIIHEQRLYFTVAGKINIHLLQPSSTDKYKIIDVLDLTRTTPDQADPFKLFSQVITGALRERDILVVSTENILDYFSLEKIKTALTQPETVTQGAQEFKQQLTSLGARQHLGALTLQIEAVVIQQKPIQEELQEFNYEQAASKDSMKVLDQTRRDTEKILAPSIMPEVKRLGATLQSLIQKMTDRFASKSQQPTTTRSRRSIRTGNQRTSKTIKKFSGSALESSMRSTKRIASKIGRGITGVLVVISNYIVLALRTLGRLLNKLLKLILGNFSKGLTTRSKLLLIVGGVVGIALIGTITWTVYSGQRSERIAEVDASIVAIENQINEAEATLIYRDENQARSSLLDARDQLNDVVPLTSEQETRIAVARDSIESVLQELRYETAISEPLIIANFNNLDAEAQLAPILIRRGDTLIAVNNRSGSLYSANTDNRELSESQSLSSQQAFVAGVLDESDNTLLLTTQSGAVTRVSAALAESAELTTPVPDNANITAITLYNSRVYMIDAQNNQIYRMTQGTTNLQALNNWIDQAVDLSAAQGLTIDGTIYVTNGSELQQYANGSLTDFELDSIDPAKGALTRIISPDGSNFLYILDPNNQRVLVFDKDGRLIRQYTSPAFDNLQAIAVDELSQSIYVLNNNIVYGIPAIHLGQ